MRTVYRRSSHQIQGEYNTRTRLGYSMLLIETPGTRQPPLPLQVAPPTLPTSLLRWPHCKSLDHSLTGRRLVVCFRGNLVVSLYCTAIPLYSLYCAAPRQVDKVQVFIVLRRT